MNNETTLEDDIAALLEAAPYEGCEQGDFWQSLCQMYESYGGNCLEETDPMVISSYCSKGFSDALEREIRLQAKNLRENFEWGEDEIVYQPTSRKERTLIRK